MPVWQVHFHVVPRRALGTTPGPLTRAILDATDWWASASLPRDYETRLAGVATVDPDSSAERQMWGAEDGNCVEVRCAGGGVKRVAVRVDVRRLDSKFGAALIVFLRAADALLVRADGLVVEPKIDAYAGALRSSAAWRYANDPGAFVANGGMNDEGSENE